MNVNEGNLRILQEAKCKRFPLDLSSKSVVWAVSAIAWEWPYEKL